MVYSWSKTFYGSFVAISNRHSGKLHHPHGRNIWATREYQWYIFDKFWFSTTSYWKHKVAFPCLFVLKTKKIRSSPWLYLNRWIICEMAKLLKNILYMHIYICIYIEEYFIYAYIHIYVYIASHSEFVYGNIDDFVMNVHCNDKAVLQTIEETDALVRTLLLYVYVDRNGDIRSTFYLIMVFSETKHPSRPNVHQNLQCRLTSNVNFIKLVRYQLQYITKIKHIVHAKICILLILNTSWSYPYLS